MESVYLNVDGHWGVVVNFHYDTSSSDDMVAIMRSFGLSDDNCDEALHILSYYNTGMCVSNEGLRMSAIFISDATSPSEWWSTAIHELKHASDSILSYYGVEWDGEDAAYLTGFLTKRLVEMVGEPCI